ncbi:MAG: zinc ABC transporter substrate-binding protein [Phycisphaerales bacterium]
MSTPPRFLWTLASLPVLAALLALAACDRRPPAPQGSATGTPYKVVTTVAMVTDIVREVAGPRAQVTGLLGEGVDPHLYKPTRSDIAALMQADVVFYNGLMLEGKMADTLVRVASSGRKVHAVTEALAPEDLLEPEEFAGHYDPHVWMDPVAWAKAAGVVRDKLIEHDPAGAEGYRERAAAYLGRLGALHEYVARVSATVPEASRVLVSAHDAFGYFGRRYGYEVVGIQGISTESEAGVRDIERLVELLVSRRVAAVFVETTVSERNIRALIAGAAARGHTVTIGGALFSDAMGAPGTYEGTYVGMIDHNATTIVRALGGQAPERGHEGKLASAGAARAPAPAAAPAGTGR